jgi:4-alpha-glucanotransferase
MPLKKQKRLPRGAGVLMPVASLPSPYGIGAFGKASFDFIDFLREAGQSYWQVLPLCPTSYGDSPYQSFSAFAGNPYFIDLDLLIEEGLLTKREVSSVKWGGEPGGVDYAAVFKSRFTVLRKAFSRSKHPDSAGYGAFLRENAFWIEDYAAYMAVKERFGWRSWQEWPEEIRLRKPRAMKKLLQELAGQLAFWRFCQFKFFRQWGAVKAYAAKAGIAVIGDIPIYVALDSADVWMHPELFDLDSALRPRNVAGVPPDYFSATGQLWGNPLYRWDRMGADGFAWWRERIRFTARLYDVIRIDHFIGVARYYAIPAGAETAMTGEYLPGPGERLLEAVNSALGGKRIIAEDLGALTPQVVSLRLRSGYPGMKVLQFAFDSGAGNEYLPTHYERNTVVYGGTHDNETLAGYFSRQKRKTLKFARDYLGVKRTSQILPALIRSGYASCADTVIFQLQDLLALGNEARINTPSTLGGNWLWRLLPGQLPEGLAQRLLGLTEVYDRRNRAAAAAGGKISGSAVTNMPREDEAR